ncbi:uncharacterized protein LOC126790974 [Argentina anserina]|uniref:uncharacterized protein LOC126790974 n=1 Tax=Argentina anserina TaxID=57926 RepID=UPI0021762C27|nr:uncharacterized protein LOC126790974 [Potentilla anserina]
MVVVKFELALSSYIYVRLRRASRHRELVHSVVSLESYSVRDTTASYNHILKRRIYCMQYQLPVRCLGRFRRVCKSWRSLISSTCFVTKHTSVAVGDRSKLKFLSSLKLPRYIDYEALLKKDDDIDIRPLVSPKLRSKYDVVRFLLDDNRFYNRVVGSCNGLICLSCDDAQEQNRNEPEFFVL